MPANATSSRSAGAPPFGKTGRQYSPSTHTSIPVCPIFGTPAEEEYGGQTRLVVRDIHLGNHSAEALEKAKTELQYAELKTEVAIDRVTSAATPRTLERVPAGAIFEPAEMVFSMYEKKDFERFKAVVDAMQLVEDDYIGGSGSRGSGKVKFRKIKIHARNQSDYSKVHVYEKEFDHLQAFSDDLGNLTNWLKQIISTE